MINNVKILISYEDPNEEPFVILDEDFQDGLEEAQEGDINPAWLPDGWLSIDLDGDDHNWYYATFEGDGYMLSRSWISNTALTQDNWLITPPVILSDDPSSVQTILHLPEERLVNLYPNPGSAIITLENISHRSIMKWEIYTTDGRLLMQSIAGFRKSAIVDIESLQPGLYLIRIYFDDQNTSTLRFIKNR